MVAGNGRQAGKGSAAGQPQGQGPAGEQHASLCEAIADGWWKQMALLLKGLPISKARGGSSQTLLLDLTAAMESPGGAGAGTSGSPWGKPASPPPGLEQDEGWEQLMSGRRSVSWDHTKGTLLVLEDTTFYCRVSTKASNSRTFFSCTASFSGSESKSSAMDCAPISMERLLS